jgi:hypothetical protein
VWREVKLDDAGIVAVLIGRGLGLPISPLPISSESGFAGPLSFSGLVARTIRSLRGLARAHVALSVASSIGAMPGRANSSAGRYPPLRSKASELAKKTGAQPQEIRLKRCCGAPGLIHHSGIEQDRAAIREGALIPGRFARCRHCGIALAPSGIDFEIFAKGLTFYFRFGERPLQRAAQSFEKLGIKSIAERQVLGARVAGKSKSSRQEPAYFGGNQQQCFAADRAFHLAKPLWIGHNFAPVMPLGVGADKFHGHRVASDCTYQMMRQFTCMREEELAAGHCAQPETSEPQSASKICKKKWA